MSYANSIKYEEIRAPAIAALVPVLEKLANPEAVLQMFQEMLKVALRMRDERYREMAFAAILETTSQLKEEMQQKFWKQIWKHRKKLTHKQQGDCIEGLEKMNLDYRVDFLRDALEKFAYEFKKEHVGEGALWAIFRAVRNLDNESTHEFLQKILQEIVPHLEPLSQCEMISVVAGAYPQQHYDCFKKAIEVAQKIEDLDEKFQALIAVAGDYNLCGKKEKARELLQLALVGVSKMESNEEKVSLLCSCINKIVPCGHGEVFSDFIKGLSLSREHLSRLLPVWRCALLEYQKNPLPALRDTMTVYPFDHALACEGIGMLQIAHMRQKNWQHYWKIENLLLR